MSSSRSFLHHHQGPSSKKPTSKKAAMDPSTLSRTACSIRAKDDRVPGATHLTRTELLMRRSQHLKKLSKCYREQYWALMEDLKAKHKEFYWRYGTSPFEEDQNQTQNQTQQLLRRGLVKENRDSPRDNGVECSSSGCKLKAMPLTPFCHLHILSDPKQQLYKACTHVIKSAQAGDITCGKPTLKSSYPSLCAVHFLKAQKQANQAIKQAGRINVSNPTQNFSLLWVEYVRFIQARRRALKAKEGKTATATAVQKGNAIEPANGC